MTIHPNQHVRTIDKGNARYRNCVGYCYSDAHRGFLTKKVMIEHKCLERKCKRFRPIEESSYWSENKKKIERKQEIREKNQQIRKTEKVLYNAISEMTDVVLCKHLYDSTYMVIINEICDIPAPILRKIMGISIYIKRIPRLKNRNIEYTYLAFLPEEMRKKAIEYKNDRRKRH